MWNTFSIEKEFTKKFSLMIDEELRLRDNFSRLNLFYTNIGASYKFIKNGKASLIYRPIQKYLGTNRSFSFRNRLMLDLSYKYKFADFSLSYRSRIQSEIRDYYVSEKGKNPEWFWRNKFEFKYYTKKFEPYFGTELRYQIIDSRNPETNYGWHRGRYFAGIDYNINKNNSFGIYFLIQKEYGISSADDLYIVGLQYSLTLERSKKNKNEE
jgi:hypothetical protein